MVWPSAMPQGRLVATSLYALQAGVLGMLAAFLLWPALLPLAGALVAAGIAAFLSRVLWMLLHLRAAPAERPRPDTAVGHALQAVGYLGLAAGTGLYLALAPAGEDALRATMLYGVFGLVGFLSQMVVGVQARIFPMAAWLQGHAARGYASQPPALHSAALVWLQRLAFGLWSVGVPLLAFGLACDRAGLTRLGASALLTATLANGVNAWRTASRLG
jgi:hypothetical protein